MVKCPICEKEYDNGSEAADDILNKGMCGECDDVLGEEAAERGEVIIGDEPIADDDMAKAVEAYKRHQAYVKDYNAKPEVKAKRKEYMRKRNQRIKQILAKAKELGLMKENEDG